MKKLPAAAWRPLLRVALREDLGPRGDLTTRLFVPPSARFQARIVSREAGVVCGLDIAAAVFKACDARARIRALARDGARVRPGQTVMTVAGGRGLLTAERTALNFIQHLSGVATLTREYADAARGTRARVLDTRKTLPGWRVLEKYAVACGGGTNHRMGLYDAVMVKDNHYMGGRLDAGAAELRRRYPRVPLIIECDTSPQVTRALRLKPDVILLDNMSPARLRPEIRKLRRLAPRVKIEVSGGVTLKNLRSIAQLNPDRISIGRLTHSAPALGFGLDLI